MFGPMALSRRQFFRRFWKPGDEPSPERLSRYEDLETYTRTQLLPYDFTLTPDQEAQLIAAVRSAMEKASNEELFSNIIRGRIEEVVDAKIQPWRERSQLAAQAGRLQEIRLAAPGYVPEFFALPENAAVIRQLKENYRIDDTAEIEKVLTDQIRLWLSETDDRLIAQYDLLTVRDLVFAQLRSWC